MKTLTGARYLSNQACVQIISLSVRLVCPNSFPGVWSLQLMADSLFFFGVSKFSSFVAILKFDILGPTLCCFCVKLSLSFTHHLYTVVTNANVIHNVEIRL